VEEDDSSEELDDEEEAHAVYTPKVAISKQSWEKIYAYMTSKPNQKQNSIIIDYGATTHMTSHPEWFDMNSFKKLDPPRRICFGDNTTTDATGVGDIWLTSKVGNKQYQVCLRNTLLVPAFHITLVSVSRLGKAGYKSTFNGCEARVAQDLNAIMIEKQCKGLYHLQAHPLSLTPAAHLAMDVNVLHRRMGHISINCLKSMVNKGQLKDINMLTGTPKFCEACVMGKMKKLPFKRSQTVARGPLDIVHSDVGGPVTPMSRDRYKYWVTFTDLWS
jgi:hypothetical protein